MIGIKNKVSIYLLESTEDCGAFHDDLAAVKIVGWDVAVVVWGAVTDILTIL